MEFFEMLDSLTDAQAKSVCDLVQSFYEANQSNKKKTVKKRPKNVKKKVVEQEDEEIDEDDEWEIKPKKKIRPNKFLKMPEFNEHKDDTEWAKEVKLYKQGITPRRPEFSKIEVICAKCGRPFEISPSVAPSGDSRLKCDRCLGGMAKSIR